MDESNAHRGRYCSKECQKKHWKHVKRQCQMWKELEEAKRFEVGGGMVSLEASRRRWSVYWPPLSIAQTLDSMGALGRRRSDSRRG